jgi:tetratricopeptide (TPR) repeat protein
LIDGPHPPTASELSAALLVTAGEHHFAPERPTAAAAACDIAERIGDGAMLKHCAEELVRIAPDDPATGRALSLLSASCPPLRFWSGWLAIFAAALGTLADALRRVSRWWPKRSSVIAAAVLTALLGSFASSTAFADESDAPKRGWLSKWTIDDKSPSSKIPSEADRNADPLQFGYWLQDVTWKGEHFSRKGDHASAAKYFGALADAVPDRAIGFTLACNEYETLGELDHAINSCGQALYREGALVKDYAHFIELVLAKPGKLAKKETDKLAEVLAHMREDPTGRGYADDLECEVGVRTSNVPQLRECTANMAAVAPNNPKILSYEWNLAIQEGKFALAREILARAGAAGLPAETILRMQKVATTTERWHWIRVGLVVLALALLLGGSGVAARMLRRRRGMSAGVGVPSVEKAVLAG